jgi:hypothetical protein
VRQFAGAHQRFSPPASSKQQRLTVVIFVRLDNAYKEDRRSAWATVWAGSRVAQCGIAA